MKKLTYEYVKDFFSKEGYILLSKSYTGAKDILKYQCPNSHINYTTWGNFQSGRRCPDCKGVKKYSFSKVKEYLEYYNYKLLSKTYKNANSKLKIQCSKGHISEMSFSNFKLGSRCRICWKNSIKGKANSNWKGGPEVSWYDTYAPQLDFCEEVCRDPNNPDYLQVKCTNSDCRKWFNPSKQQTSQRVEALRGQVSGDSRFYCSEECKQSCSIFGSYIHPRKFTYKYVKDFIEDEGYKLLSKEYKNSNTKLKLMCPQEHIYKTTFATFKKGYRCKKCYYKKLWKGGPDVIEYDTYAPQIDWCEEVRRDPIDSKLLQVKCTNSDCRKWFRPSRHQVYMRIGVLEGRYLGEGRFYCSEECKQSCSIYGQYLYPKGFKQDNIYRIPEWAEMVKERDGYICQKCGSKENLEAHHIEGIWENPLESADIDLGITLCESCHKEAHSENGCRYYDLRKDQLCA